LPKPDVLRDAKICLGGNTNINTNKYLGIHDDNIASDAFATLYRALLISDFFSIKTEDTSCAPENV